MMPAHTETGRLLDMLLTHMFPYEQKTKTTTSEDGAVLIVIKATYRKCKDNLEQYTKA